VVREKEAEIEAARRKRGAMTGREIFAEVSLLVVNKTLLSHGCDSRATSKLTEVICHSVLIDPQPYSSLVRVLPTTSDGVF
jgi:hypothetical protein